MKNEEILPFEHKYQEYLESTALCEISASERDRYGTIPLYVDSKTKANNLREKEQACGCQRQGLWGKGNWTNMDIKVPTSSHVGMQRATNTAQQYTRESRRV